MPGHWLLARMGKRVLRPGGIELTRKLLDDLQIQSSDDVVEFAPGLGVTARMTLAHGPHTYTAVERDCKAAAEVQRLEPRRLISDEGLFRALRFVFNVARTPAARKRVLAMRRVFRKFGEHLSAIALIAEKPNEKLVV